MYFTATCVLVWEYFSTSEASTWWQAVHWGMCWQCLNIWGSAECSIVVNLLAVVNVNNTVQLTHTHTQVQGPGIVCLTISAIHHSSPAPSDQHWRLTSSQRTGTRSAVEAFCVMRFTNRRSSSPSHWFSFWGVNGAEFLPCQMSFWCKPNK